MWSSASAALRLVRLRCAANRRVRAVLLTSATDTHCLATSAMCGALQPVTPVVFSACTDSACAVTSPSSLTELGPHAPYDSKPQGKNRWPTARAFAPCLASLARSR